MAAILFALLPAAVHAQGMREDYRRAEQFLAPNIRRLVFEGQVAANWIEKSSRFWYRNDKPAGKEFILVDAAQNTRQPAFDHEKLAASLSRAAAKSYRANTLPFDSITFVEDGRAIQFDIERTRWICNLTTYECAPGKEEEPRRAPRQGPGQATRPPRLDVPSPDGKLTAFVRSHNIYVRVVATGGEVPLSRDGEKFYDYATPLPSPALIANPYSGRSGIH
jgi:hypothetical protein